jgi:hypothetical protein
MLTRTITAICVAAALAIPVNAAQAGPLLDRIKNTVKNEAKLVKPIAFTVLNDSKKIAKCIGKAATSKPCV